LDGVWIEDFQVSEQEFEQACQAVDERSIESLQHAADNIRLFHARQDEKRQPVEVQSGVVCWRESRPIEKVGLYIPGGTAVLPSTLLMLGIPARLAGCRQISVCVPPRRDGSVAAEVLAAARVAGLNRVFKLGGAQAVAAMALGTESIERVDKIFGPGNRWVQAAKLLAFQGGTAIDLPAGPSEVLVVADSKACPRFVAADLIAQAEHGSDSQAVLATDSAELVREVELEVARQLDDLPRKNLASQAIQTSFSVLAESLGEAIGFANRYAPEHLILNVQEAANWAEKVVSAGSVFLGPYSPEVAGDYASGTNHTLPTSGAARAFSGVSLDSFVKKITFQQLTPEGLANLAPTLERLATIEGLEGHRRAVRIRQKESGVRNQESGRSE
jgi:histidinol dehydrogenase